MKMVNKLIRNTQKDGTDIHKAILDWRNTPLEVHEQQPGTAPDVKKNSNTYSDIRMFTTV